VHIEIGHNSFNGCFVAEIGADIRLKTVLMFPVTLLDLQDTTLLSYIEKSHRFLLNYNDRLKKHNTEGWVFVFCRGCSQPVSPTPHWGC